MQTINGTIQFDIDKKAGTLELNLFDADDDNIFEISIEDASWSRLILNHECCCEIKVIK